MPSPLRRLFAHVLVLPLVAIASVFVQQTVSSAATVPAGPGCNSQTATVPTAGGSPYYLFQSNGIVVSCGGAPLHGYKKRVGLANPIVGGAATAAGGGYWLVAAHGQVYVFGNAKSYGSANHLQFRTPIAGFAPTPDGKGYWLVSAAGNLFHYGDAGFYGSTVRDKQDGTVVALLPTPDGKGYWVVNSTGVVHNFGDAAPLGSLAHRRPPVIAASASPDGRGLLLLTKDGGVHNLGTTAYYGSLVHQRLARPLTAIASSLQGSGYLLVDGAGSVFNFGGIPFEGSLAAVPPSRPTRVIAIVEVAPPVTILTTTPVGTDSLAPGSFGYDISNFQCSSPGSSLASSSLPPSASFAVIEAAGWLDSSFNSCLAAEAAWATAAAGSSGGHYNLYLFMNAPGQSSAANALDANGPAGQCSTLVAASQPGCIAYNYGYEGATAAFSSAASIGVSSSIWWLDVEGTNLSSTNYSNFNAGQFWSSKTALNDETIQGAIDAIRAKGTTAGIYSSSVQFPTIAGSFVPSGAQVPLWIAGVPYTNPPFTENGLAPTSILKGWCLGTSGYTNAAPTDLFAGGVPWLLQETPGGEAAPYGIDPDYAC